MKVNYSQGKIYKITNDFNNEVYVGSTCDTLAKRFSGHKLSMINVRHENRPLYILMNEIGFERFRIELIELCPYEDKYQLRQREGHFIRELGTLNKSIAGRTKQEWTEEKKERIKMNVDKEARKLYNMKYNEEHKEQHSIKRKVYKEANKEKLRENKNKKLICICGCECNNSSLRKHEKTKKHIELIEAKNSQTTE